MEANECESTLGGEARCLPQHLYAMPTTRHFSYDRKFAEVRRLRWLTTLLDQPRPHPRRALGIEEEATYESSLATRDIEISAVDRAAHLVSKPTGRPLLDASALMPLCRRIENAFYGGGIRRPCTSDRQFMRHHRTDIRIHVVHAMSLVARLSPGSCPTSNVRRPPPVGCQLTA